MNSEVKFFEIKHSEGTEVVVANYVREAVNYYFNEYMDDLHIEDMIESGGISIKEITGEALTEKRTNYNEELSQKESVSYLEIAKDATQIPTIIVTPYY